MSDFVSENEGTDRRTSRTVRFDPVEARKGGIRDKTAGYHELISSLTTLRHLQQVYERGGMLI